MNWSILVGSRKEKSKEAKMTTEAQKKASAKWDAANTIQFKLKLHKTHDKAIIEKLKSVSNKQGYIKDLIKADITQNIK